MKEPTEKDVELIAKRYANHVITDRHQSPHFRCWRFQNPGTGIYSFEVVALRDAVIIHGDIGHLAFQYKTLEWCRGVLTDMPSISWGYVLEKVVRQIEPEEFSESEALAIFKERMDEMGEDEDKELAANLLEYGFESRADFEEALEEIGERDPWEYNPTQIKHDVVNQVIALREFIKHLDSESAALFPATVSAGAI